MILVGVDGGGTRCRARAATADGRTIGEAETGTANLLAGLDRARENVLGAIVAALSRGGLGPDDLGRCVAGLGLAGANVADLREGFVAAGLPIARFAVESDAFVACRGAHGDRDGAIAILGTGTAYVGRRNGRFRSLGGWGFALSDHGSGADLGRAAMKAALLAHDGIGEASPMTAAVLERFGHSPDEMVAFADAALPRDFGAFAPVVLDHADQDDPVASAIVAEALAHIVRAIDRLTATGTAEAALLGGLAARYRPRLEGRLKARIVEPEADAMAGGLALARELAESI